jgi:redox-sensitive bicupin YhaK (pirin superfamily)
MKTQANASVYAATLNGDQTISQDLDIGRQAWVQVADGALRVNDHTLKKGDGLAIEGGGVLTFDQGQDAEFLYFDLMP